MDGMSFRHAGTLDDSLSVVVELRTESPNWAPRLPVWPHANRKIKVEIKLEIKGQSSLLACQR
jgi:hypothetical protein